MLFSDFIYSPSIFDIVSDEKYLVHDTYTLFSHLLKIVGRWFAPLKSGNSPVQSKKDVSIYLPSPPCPVSPHLPFSLFFVFSHNSFRLYWKRNCILAAGKQTNRYVSCKRRQKRKQNETKQKRQKKTKQKNKRKI